MIDCILPAAFQFCFMALAVDAMDRHGPDNEMRHQLQLKKTSVAVFYPSFLANKTERFSFKSGCVIRVENGEIRHQLQLKKNKIRLY